MISNEIVDNSENRKINMKLTFLLIKFRSTNTKL